MEIEDLIKAIKLIEIKSRKKIGGNLSSSYRNLFKGKGLSFSGVREYSYGDDVRLIEWNSSARMNSLYVKDLLEERELNVYVALDISGSMFMGSGSRNKFEVGAIIATMILFSAIYNGDRCSLILFGGDEFYFSNFARRAEEVFPFLKKIIEFHGEKRLRRDNFSDLFFFLTKKVRKRGILFLISDFIYSELEAQFFSVISKIYEVVCIGVLDKVELDLPEGYFFSFFDPEREMVGKAFVKEEDRKVYSELVRERINYFKSRFNVLGIRGDFLLVSERSEIDFMELLFGK